MSDYPLLNHHIEENALNDNSMQFKEVINNAVVSTWRKPLSQVLAVLAKNLVIMNFASVMGFNAILIPNLLANPADTGADNNLHLTKEQMSWYASMDRVLICVCALVSGWVTKPFGRRTSMMAYCIPMVISWIIVHYAISLELLYVYAVIGAIGHGIIEASITTYIAEICEPKLRGSMTVSTAIIVRLGLLIQFMLNNFLEWRTIALVNISIPVAAFIALYLVPESPYWLINRGRLKDAEESLCWLRGWVPRHMVQKELAEIVAAQDSLTVSTHPWSTYTQPSFYKPMLLIIGILLLESQIGLFCLPTYVILIFQALGSPLNAKLSGTLVTGAQLVGAIASMISVPFLGRRRLLLGASCITLLLYASIAGYAGCKHLGFDVQAYMWIPLASLLATNFALNGVMKPLMLAIIPEIFSTELRAVGAGLGMGINSLAHFFSIKTYFIYLDFFQYWGLFTYYSIFLLPTILYFYFLWPETEGHSIVEIAKYFTGNTNIARESRKTSISR